MHKKKHNTFLLKNVENLSKYDGLIFYLKVVTTLFELSVQQLCGHTL